MAKKSKKLKLFTKILNRFDHKVVDGKVLPVLVKGTIAELFNFIEVELEKEKDEESKNNNS